MKRIFLLTALFILSITQSSYGLRCKQTKCLECPKTDENKVDSEVECAFRNLFDLSWMGEANKPISPNTQPPPNPEYSCIQMIASNSKIDGDNTDIMRGCVMRHEADAMCKNLQELEKSKGKEAACKTCTEDNCNERNNARMSATVSTLTLFVMFISSKLLV